MAESRSALKAYAKPQKISYQDGVAWKKSEARLSLYKVRYSYSPKRTQKTSRDFCVKMVDIARENITYRWEDIYKMGRDGVNSELAARGHSTYSIWLYKGGKYCHHFWTRRVFLRKWAGINVPEWIGTFMRGKENMKRIMKIGEIDVDPNVNSWATMMSGSIIKEMPLADIDKVRIFQSIKDPELFVTHRIRQFITLYLESVGMPVSLILKTLEGALSSLDKATAFLNKISKGKDRKLGVPVSRSDTKNLENDDEIGVREARRRNIRYIVNRRRVTIKPIDMKDGGAYRGGGEVGYAVRRAPHEAGLIAKREIKRTVSQIERELLERSKRILFGY